jgi:hypothetical protein
MPVGYSPFLFVALYGKGILAIILAVKRFSGDWKKVRVQLHNQRNTPSSRFFDVPRLSEPLNSFAVYFPASRSGLSA